MPEIDLAFATRAHQEAARYGPDPWVFVRELLQNARDAGARSIRLRVEREGARERVVCEDDGEGMSFSHARRYLFSLYASSKEGRRNRAGRFGVGFWSVLRFEPDSIEIASRPRRGEAWCVGLDGALSRAERLRDGVPLATGTRVLLERVSRDDALERRVADAVRQSARDLRQRDRPERRIDVRVDGRPANRPLTLPAPSISFQHGRQRGVIGLGPAPGVELFSQGLRVRSAAALPDLLEAGSRASELTRVRFPELADGVAPRALLEGGALELSLARRDARETRSLRRLVRVAQRELGRLVERQLEHADARSAWRRGLSRLAANPLLLGLTVALAAGGLLGHAWQRTQRGAPAARAASPDRAEASAELDPLAAGHRDLGAAYGGPAVSGGGGLGSGQPLLRYAPAGAGPLYFGALRIEQLDARGRPVLSNAAPLAAPAYRCQECREVELDFFDGPGPLRLPVPSGHAVDSSSVRLDQVRLPLQLDSLGQPLVALTAPTRGRLRYRTGPTSEAPRAAARPQQPLPEALAAQVARLRLLPPAARGPVALAWTRSAIRYSLSDAVAEQHRLLAATPFLQRSLGIGAGDCDVQSGVLLPLLQDAGIPARIAVGYVGNQGVALARLHAWVEYAAADGHWRVADASAGAPLREPPTPRQPAPRAAPAPSSAQAAAPARGPGWTPSALAALLAALLAAAGLIWRARRGRRTLQLPAQPDLPGLLRGALQRPDAFRDAPSVFQRRLLPLASGGLASLSEVWERAHEGRLFSSRRRPALARDAARGGAAVLDERRAVARSVAETLGALPLDEWDAKLSEAAASPALDALERALANSGEAWQLRLGRAPELEALELPRRGGVARYALVPRGAPELREAERLWRTRPRLALLRLGEWLAAALDLTRKRELLATLAADALREAAS